MGPPGPPGARGPAGPSASESPPLPPVIGFAKLGDLAGDSTDQAYPSYFEIRRLKFHVQIPTTQRSGMGDVPVPRAPVFDGIEIVIADQGAVASLFGTFLQGSVLPGSNNDNAEIVLLSEMRTGDPEIDELMKITLSETRIASLDYLPANTPGDPALVRVWLRPIKIEVAIANSSAAYDFQSLQATPCGTGVSNTFANAPGLGNSLFGIPTSSFALTALQNDTTGSGSSSGFGPNGFSDLTLITGLVPEMPCLFGWMFENRSATDVIVDSYGSFLDTNPILSLKLKGQALVGFELETNSAGGVDLRLRFAFARLEVTYGVTSVVFPPNNKT